MKRVANDGAARHNTSLENSIHIISPISQRASEVHLQFDIVLQRSLKFELLLFSESLYRLPHPSSIKSTDIQRFDIN